MRTETDIGEAIEQSSAAAANMKARAKLMMALQEEIAGWKLTQAESAKKLGMTQPRMNDLLRGRIDKFSLDALMLFATSAGLKIEWRIKKSAA